MLRSGAAYVSAAEILIARYERADPLRVHAHALHLIPAEPRRALDIGAGTGRDAAWLAGMGHDVVAVEPTAPFREAGAKLHPSPRIEWVDDMLPDLAVLGDRAPFEMIFATAVWMHLDEAERMCGMARLAQLAADDALIFMLLRHGPVPEGRVMFEVSGEETIALARPYGFAPVVCEARASLQDDAPSDVHWTALALKRG